LRVVLVTAIAALSCVPSANAQERMPNPGTQGVLRVWPNSGVWGVRLVRTTDGGLGCQFVTGHAERNTGELYLWGIRWRPQSMGATIIDNNRQAIAGPSIQIVIDSIPIGKYEITRRLDGANGFQGVVAEFSPTENERIVSLVSVGGSMQFVTNTFTYSASLQGAQQAMSSLRECSVEANHLDTTSAKSGDTSKPNTGR